MIYILKKKSHMIKYIKMYYLLYGGKMIKFIEKNSNQIKEAYSIKEIKDKVLVQFTKEGKEYDISYINEGDLLICNGTLIEKSGHFYGFDTKDNKIMFFKKSDLDKIKNNAILNNLTSCSSITIHSIFSNYMYIEFNLEYITNLGEKYTLSFIEKMYYSDISNISGQLSVHNSIKNIKLNIYDITIPDISIISMELN